MPMSKQRGEQKEGKPGIEYSKIGWSLLLKKNQKTVHKVKGFKIQYFYATVRVSNFAKKSGADENDFLSRLTSPGRTRARGW